MNKFVLIKPDISYKNDLQAFRQEMLEASSSMDGQVHSNEWIISKIDRIQ